MKTKLIISANGKDKKGIVSDISSIIASCKGNIETSRMIRLEKEFAMLILVEINDKHKDKLNETLKKNNHLHITIINTNDQIPSYKTKCHLYINGADNEGIVYQFTNCLSKMNINIEEVNTRIENAPISATPLFMMDLVIASETKINKDVIFDKLLIISERLGVEIKIDDF